jgi:putative transposase
MILLSIGRSVSDLKVHLVLVTKYRRKAFTSEMLNRPNIVMGELLEKWDCKLVEFNGEEDHVHLLFQYHPDVELSKLFRGNRELLRGNRKNSWFLNMRLR